MKAVAPSTSHPGSRRPSLVGLPSNPVDQPGANYRPVSREVALPAGAGVVAGGSEARRPSWVQTTSQPSSGDISGADRLATSDSQLSENLSEKNLGVGTVSGPIVAKRPIKKVNPSASNTPIVTVVGNRVRKGAPEKVAMSQKVFY